MYIYVLKCSTHTQESFTSMSGYPFDNLNIHDWMKKCAAKTSLLREKIMIATVTPGLRGDSAQREVSVEYLLLYYISSKPIFNNVQSCSKHNLSGMLFCGFSILWTYNLSSVFITICLFFLRLTVVAIDWYYRAKWQWNAQVNGVDKDCALVPSWIYAIFMNWY